MIVSKWKNEQHCFLETDFFSLKGEGYTGTNDGMIILPFCTMEPCLIRPLIKEMVSVVVQYGEQRTECLFSAMFVGVH